MKREQNDVVLVFCKPIDSTQTHESTLTRPSLCKLDRVYYYFDYTHGLNHEGSKES